MKVYISILLVAMAGICMGIAAFTMHYGEGTSYFSSDPRACVNCHIMRPQYDSWQKASHHTVANCNDCHLPHGFFDKWLAKAENGYLHSKAFTLQDFHEPIFVREKNKKILNNNCKTCHAGLMHESLTTFNGTQKDLNCLHCHKSVGHGATTGMGKLELSLLKPKKAK